MKMTIEQYNTLKGKGLTDTQIADVSKKKGVALPEEVIGASGLKGVFKGAVKSVVGTVRGMGEFGQDFLQNTAGRAVQAITGVDRNTLGTDLYDPESARGGQFKENLKAKGTAEGVGKFAGDVAQFLVPGTAVSKMGKGASLLARAGADALTAGTVSTAQEGELNKNVAINAGASGALTLAAPLAGALFRKATTELPEWLVRPLVKQSKQAKIAGKDDAAKLLVESGRIGTVDSILTKTSDAIKTLDDQVDGMIKTATSQGKTINMANIRQSIVDKINLAGGEIEDDGVRAIMDNLAPQVKGLLKKDVLTVEDANALRKAIDRTLGDRAFFATQLPYNKNVALDFVGALRESVKKELPEVARPAYAEMSKNIELRKALLSRAMESGGKNSVGLYDILTGLGVGMAVNPVAGIATAGIRRGLESAPVKTAGAQFLTKLQKAGPALDAMHPTERAVIMTFLQNVFGDDQSQEQQPKTGTQTQLQTTR